MTEWIERLVRDRTVWAFGQEPNSLQGRKDRQVPKGTGIYRPALSDAVDLYDGEWMSTSMTQRSMLDYEAYAKKGAEAKLELERS